MKLLQALIYEQQRKTAVEERDEKRRQQIGSGERSERIRTYNFPQVHASVCSELCCTDSSSSIYVSVYGNAELLIARKSLPLSFLGSCD